MKRIVSLILALVMVFALTACDGKTAKTPAIELTDQAGRTVSLEKTAEKVISCYYITSYAMLSLGAKDKLVGIEKKADSRPIYAMTDPELLSLDQVGSMKELNIEAIAALEADLVLMPKKLMDYIPAIEETGAQVLVADPEDEERLCEMLTLIAKACGKEKECEALLKFRQEKLDSIADLKALSYNPTVYFCGNSSYLTCAPLGMYQSTLITNACGINAAEIEGDYWTEVSYESILAMNPDIVIIPSDAEYSVEDFCSDAELASLSAIQNGKVYKMPGSFEAWDSPIPSGVLGTLWMAYTLHEEIYTLDQFKNDVKEFYGDFYGFTPDEELLEKLG